MNRNPNQHVIQSEEVCKKLTAARTAEEAMDISGLNWTTEEVELVTTNGLDVPQAKGLFRSDTKAVIGVVGRRYKPLQNHEAFAFADAVVQKHDATYEYAYCLNGGSNILIQLKVNGGFEARPGDHLDKYINISNHHDGGGSVVCFTGTNRAWCANQFRIMVQNAQDTIRIHHKGSLTERFADASRLFHLSLDTFEVFQKQCQFLAQKQLDKAMVERFLDTVVGKPVEQVKNEETGLMELVERPRIQAKRDKIVDLFENGRGNGQNTAWDLLNGATEYVDHFTNVDNADRRFASALIGHGAEFKQTAFEAAMAL